MNKEKRLKTIRIVIGIFAFIVVMTAYTYIGAATTQPMPPEIIRTETFREGNMVFIRLFFTDPNDDTEGFGFRGIYGSGWSEETHSFSNPSYGRVSPGQIEYPFNLNCETGAAYESDVEAWVYDSSGLTSPPVKIHLACRPFPQVPQIWFALLTIEIVFAGIPAIPISIFRKRNYLVCLWIQTKSLFVAFVIIMIPAVYVLVTLAWGVIFFLGVIITLFGQLGLTLIFIAIYGIISLYYHKEDNNTM